MANDKNKLFETIYLLWKGEGEKHIRLEELYKLEAEYRMAKLDSKAITARRNDEKTESIVQSIRIKLLELKELISGRKDYQNLLPATIKF